MTAKRLDDHLHADAPPENEAAIDRLVRLACDQLPVGIGVATPDMRLAYCNDALARMGGYGTVRDAVGKVPREAVPEIAGLLEGLYARVLSGEAVRDLQIVGRTGPNGEKPGEWEASYLPVVDPHRPPGPQGPEAGAPTIEGIGVLVVDVEAQRYAERALRQREEQFRRLADRAPIGIGLLDADGRLLYLNASGECILGRPSAELIRDGWMRTVHPDDRAEAAAEAAASRVEGRAIEGVYRYLHEDGTVTTARLRATPLVDDQRFSGHVVVFEDITERLRLEEQVSRARRMESIGRLAGGVAHDFNNLLTIILTTAAFLRDATAGDPQAGADVVTIVETANRARALTRQLLTFAQRQPSSRRPVALGPLVSRLSELLRRVISESITLSVETLVPDDESVLGDESQLEQLVMNLALNGRDAMPAGGQLTVSIEQARLDERAAEVLPGRLRSGDYLVLSVRDTGFGITPQVMAHLFEPFFTTKPVGKGSGMGLATCYGIVQQMGGQIACESVPGAGTVFRCYLPRTGKAPARPLVPEADLAPARGGRESLLLVEDEPTVRHVAARALRDLGYRVITAQHGGEALNVLEAAHTPFDLVITDLVMPVMGGIELAARLRERAPALGVLFTSGHVADFSEQISAIEPRRFLAKPYLPEDMARRVRELLDDGSGRGEGDTGVS